MKEPSIRRSRSRGRLRFAAGVVAAMAASGPGGARLAAAGSERVALIWNAPGGCPTTQAILDEVERTLAGSPRDVAPVAAAVNVVPPSEGRWRANLVIHSHGTRAERQFEAESCEALASATALIVGLAAEGADEAAPPRSAGQVEPPANRADNAIAAAPAPGPTKPGAEWTESGPYLLVAGLLDAGTMPDPAGSAPGIEAAAGQSWTTSIWRMRLGAGASFFPEQDLPNTFTFGVPYGRYWMVTFSGRGCLTAVLSRFEIGPCLGGELAFMHSTGIGGPTATDTQYWASMLGSAVVGLTVASRVVVFARPEVVFPTTRRSFPEVNQGGAISDVYKIPAHAFRAVLGVELRF